MWVLAPHTDAATPAEDQRIQSQNLIHALQKTYLLLPDADNVLSRLPNAFSSATSGSSSSSPPRPFRPIKILEQSISGSHATLNFTRPDSIDNPDARPEVTLTDKSSYGSWVNGMRIHRTAKRLSDGDLLEFGGNRLVKFYLRYQPLVVTISGVSDEVKASLALTVGKLGGHVVSDWRRNVSTHCCMESISVTIKTVSAMVALKPVVTPAYFDAYLSAALKDVDASTAPPDVTDFLPDVSDSQLTGRNDMSFLIRRSRATVFKEKTFYFFDRKQYKKCFAVVEMGGGVTALIEDAEALKKASLDQMTQDDSIVMQPNPERASQSFATSVQKALDKRNLRWIDTPEIGYAIIYSSTQLFANPTVGDPMSIWAQGGSATERRDGRGEDRDQYATEEDDSSAASAPKRQKLNPEAQASTPSTTRSPHDDGGDTASVIDPKPPAPLAEDSLAIPDELPTHPVDRKTTNDDVAATSRHDTPDPPSTSRSNVSDPPVASIPAASAVTSSKSSSLFKRLLHADSDDEEEDEEEERKKKKLKLERDEEVKRGEEKARQEDRRKQLVREKEEEERRKVEDQKRREEQMKEREDEERRRREKEGREEERKRREKQMEERDNAERRRREKEEEEEEDERKKKQKAMDEDFSDYDIDDQNEGTRSPVEPKERDPAMERPINVHPRPVATGGNIDEEFPIKREVPSQVTQNNDEDQPLTNGWIRKPVKTRGREELNSGLSSLHLEMMVEEVNLVVRRARAAAAPRDETEMPRTDNHGMPVKNFKRFKRSARRNHQDMSRMVIDLVPVAMNAAPPETFQPNTLSSTASFNRTGNNASSLSNGFSSGTSLNGTHSTVPSSASMSNGLSGRSGAMNGSERDSHFDVDFGDDVVVNGHAPEAEVPRQSAPQPANGAVNQVPDEFFDFDF